MSHSLLVFAFATVVGASLFGVRWLMRGSADPFTVGWPLDLQLVSLSLTFLSIWFTSRPFLTAIGIYCGLVGNLLVCGHSEYPVTSVIALTIHGLFPALTGALIGVITQTWLHPAAKNENT